MANLFDINFCTVKVCNYGEGAIKTWNMLSAEYHLGPESFLSFTLWLKQSLRSGRSFSEVLLIQMEILHLKFRITKFTDISVLNLFTKKLISNCFVHPTSQERLLGKLNLQDLNRQMVYMLPRLCTTDSHTRIFQYKILNNIFYLNNRPFKMNIVNLELCSFR